MTALNQQFGIKAESTYGTPVAVDRFYEINSESLALDMGRVRSAGRRQSQKTHRTDRFMPYVRGGVGGFSLDVPTKGFGVLLNQITGGTASVGIVTDSNYTQTHTLGTMLGKMFTAQVNRPMVDATDQKFTYHGCKVLSAEFACDAESVLTCAVNIDAEDMDTSTALATCTYPTGFHVFTWVGGALTIAAANVEISNFKCTITNPMKTDRYYIRSSSLKKQPVVNDLRSVMFEFTADFDSMTQYQRFSSATAAGALGAVVGTFTGDIFHAGATYPELKFTAPNCDFVEVDGPNLNGNEHLTVTYRALALDDGSSEPLTITYRTTDSAI